MPKRTHLQQLEAALNDKVQQLGRAKARKVLVDTQKRLLEDAVEHYRKAIATERKKQLRRLAKAQDASSSESSGDENGEQAVPARGPAVLAIEDRPRSPAAAASADTDTPEQLPQPPPAQPGLVVPDAGELVDEWLPADGTWEELATKHAGLRYRNHPEEPACCAGMGKDGIACTRSSTLRRPNTTTLRKWPAAWDRGKVRLNPYPLICGKCDSALRRF